uniref:Transposase n=1 Tax=Peronospora matthiolae TaxID=2874970 RepID=A0AAV1TSD2_9STRA
MPQLRDTLQHEMALTHHLRQQVDLRHNRMSLLVADLSHYDIAGEPLGISPGFTQGKPQHSTTDDRPTAPAAGTLPRRKESRTSAHPA